MDSLEFPTISLFSGLGGIDQGLELAGFDIKVCIEANDDRVATIRSNRPKWDIIHDRIENVPISTILRKAGLDEGETFMVAGGPPCQPFSKSAFWVQNRAEKIHSDPRTRMLDEFLRIVKGVKPNTFLFENVSGLSYKTSKDVLIPFIEGLHNEGYTINHRVLNAVDYGVPQKRKRLFIIGARNGLELNFPEPTHAKPSEFSENKLIRWATAGDAFEKLDDEDPLEHEIIGGKYGHLLNEIPPGENYLFLTEKRGHPNPKFKWRSKFWTFLLKLSKELPSWTIQASPAKYQGPFHWKNRQLRKDELKALQCINANWIIHGNEKSVRSQIGDACPPPLIEVIAKKIIESS